MTNLKLTAEQRLQISENQKSLLLENLIKAEAFLVSIGFTETDTVDDLKKKDLKKLFNIVYENIEVESDGDKDGACMYPENEDIEDLVVFCSKAHCIEDFEKHLYDVCFDGIEIEEPLTPLRDLIKKLDTVKNITYINLKTTLVQEKQNLKNRLKEIKIELEKQKKQKQPKKGAKTYTIKDLRKGVCAVKNDGTVEELKEVLSRAFPEDRCFLSGNYVFYFKDKDLHTTWCHANETNLPTQSVKDFLSKI